MIEQRSKVFSCFLDVQKAFDTIWIDSLLFKLYNELGINSQLWLIIKELYTNIHACVTAGVYFVLRGKTRVISNCSNLFRSHMLCSCQFPVGIPYFAQVSTFVVYSVTNFKSNGRKNG